MARRKWSERECSEKMDGSLPRITGRLTMKTNGRLNLDTKKRTRGNHVFIIRNRCLRNRHVVLRVPFSLLSIVRIRNCEIWAVTDRSVIIGDCRFARPDNNQPITWWSLSVHTSQSQNASAYVQNLTPLTRSGTSTTAAFFAACFARHSPFSRSAYFPPVSLSVVCRILKCQILVHIHRAVIEFLFGSWHFRGSSVVWFCGHLVSLGFSRFPSLGRNGRLYAHRKRFAWPTWIKFLEIGPLSFKEAIASIS